MSDERVERALADVRRAGLDEPVAARLVPAVFVVTSGDYSDYHIDCVFLARARAEAFVASNPGASMHIEEWATVAQDGDLDPGAFEVYLMEDGSASHSWLEPGKRCIAPRVHWYRGTGPWEGVPCVRFYGYGKTEEHARRAAENLRREWLAAGYTAKSYVEEQEAKAQ